jgi:hypothetical protein
MLYHLLIINNEIILFYIFSYRLYLNSNNISGFIFLQDLLNFIQILECLNSFELNKVKSKGKD